MKILVIMYSLIKISKIFLAVGLIEELGLEQTWENFLKILGKSGNSEFILDNWIWMRAFKNVDFQVWKLFDFPFAISGLTFHYFSIFARECRSCDS